MGTSAHSLLIPHRMIQNDQRAWVRMKSGEDLPQHSRIRLASEFLHRIHDRSRTEWRQVVDAEVEEGISDGNGPLNGDRHCACRIDGLKGRGSFDVVMVRKGDQR